MFAHAAFVAEESEPGGRRAGILSAHGWRVRTPAVAPVGPLATAGSLTADDLSGCGVRALGVDWLRLWLRPGVEALAVLGGLRRFLGWSGPKLPGPAAWAFEGSSSRVRGDEAVVVSPFDGSTHRLTPEVAVEAQLRLGLDVVATLDWPDSAARGSTDGEVAGRRLAWAERSLAATDGRALLVASVSLDWPIELIRELGRLPFGGFALDGLGEELGDETEPHARLGRALAELPAAALRVVDWRGGVEGLAEVVGAGADVVRLLGEADRAAEGTVLTRDGALSALSDEWRDDPSPLESECRCSTCRRFSRAYVRHLFAANELLGPRLVELHNLSVELGRSGTILAMHGS